MIFWPPDPSQAAINQCKLFRDQYQAILLIHFIQQYNNMSQNGYVNNYQGRQSRRETRKHKRRRRKLSRSQRRKMHNARVPQPYGMSDHPSRPYNHHCPCRPFYQRLSVTGYKHLPPHPNTSQPTNQRWQLLHGRGGFNVINERRSIHYQNHRQTSPFTFKSRYHHHHYRMHPIKHRLSRMDHIIFWDIDNWSRFFEKLKFFLPYNVFVWGFHSIKWNQPTRCLAFHRLITRGGFHKNYQSGRTENAADFAIMLQIGKMDELLPKYVQFTIFSGDRGFQEALHQMNDSGRIIRLLNPHIPGWQSRLHHILSRSIRQV